MLIAGLKNSLQNMPQMASAIREETLTIDQLIMNNHGLQEGSCPPQVFTTLAEVCRFLKLQHVDISPDAVQESEDYSKLLYSCLEKTSARHPACRFTMEVTPSESTSFIIHTRGEHNHNHPPLPSPATTEIGHAQSDGQGYQSPKRQLGEVTLTDQPSSPRVDRMDTMGENSDDDVTVLYCSKETPQGESGLKSTTSAEWCDAKTGAEVEQVQQHRRSSEGGEELEKNSPPAISIRQSSQSGRVIPVRLIKAARHSTSGNNSGVPGLLHESLWPGNDNTPELSCPVCKYECKSSSALARHMWMHGSNQKYRCRECDYSSNSHSTIRSHVKLHGVKGAKKTCLAPIPCKKCPAVVHVCQYNWHQRLHGASNCFKCNQCDFSPKSRETLFKHMRLHLAGEGGVTSHTHGKTQAFACGKCPAKFLTLTRLTAHRKLHGAHSFSSKLRGTLPIRMRAPRKVEKKQKFQCEKCPADFHSQYHLARHMAAHGAQNFFRCGHCDFSPTVLQSLQRHMQLHGNKTCEYQCNQCPEVFPGPHRLRQHFRHHGANGVYKCLQCDFSAGYPLSLARHKQAHERSSAEALRPSCSNESLQQVNTTNTMVQFGQGGLGGTSHFTEINEKEEFSLTLLPPAQGEANSMRSRLSSCGRDMAMRAPIRDHPLANTPGTIPSCSHRDGNSDQLPSTSGTNRPPPNPMNNKIPGNFTFSRMLASRDAMRELCMKEMLNPQGAKTEETGTWRGYFACRAHKYGRECPHRVMIEKKSGAGEGYAVYLQENHAADILHWRYVHSSDEAVEIKGEIRKVGGEWMKFRKNKNGMQVYKCQMKRCHSRVAAVRDSESAKYHFYRSAEHTHAAL